MPELIGRGTNQNARNTWLQPGCENDMGAGAFRLDTQPLGLGLRHPRRSNAGVRDASTYRRAQEIRLTLTHASDHHAHAVKRRLDRSGIINVESPCTHAASLLGMAPGNDHAIRLRCFELSGEATADFAVATHHQDVVAAHDLRSGV